MTKNEAMKVIAEASCERACPIVDEIAKRAAYAFEFASETVMENDEDNLIFDIMMRLFANGFAMEAVDVLMLSFYLLEMTDIFGLQDSILSDILLRQDALRQEFSLSFLKHGWVIRIFT